jgi:hypothetical protein
VCGHRSFYVARPCVFIEKAEFCKKKSAINNAKGENEKSAAQALDLEQTPGFIMAAERNPPAKTERSGVE